MRAPPLRQSARDPNASDPRRFDPHARREMASMFDDVSGRYDLLNRLMTLGQDGWWRESMWRAVPESARVVVDLCTGSGVSLPGLRRVGRTVLGVDVSLAMLRHALEEHGAPGWGPRIVCADGFRLPLRDGSVEAITVAFGVRNLRPRAAALAEMARVLRPGGVLSVLEASAPAPGPLAPLHRLWVRHVIPFAGRLSPDPSAYRYLSDSIFEFGFGPEFEAAMADAGFAVTARRSFLLGATRLWVARRRDAAGQIPPEAVQSAAAGGAKRSDFAQGGSERERERRVWEGFQILVSAGLAAALVWSLGIWHKLNGQIALEPWQRPLGWTLLVLGTLGFVVRLGIQVARFLSR